MTDLDGHIHTLNGPAAKLLNVGCPARSRPLAPFFVKGRHTMLAAMQHITEGLSISGDAVVMPVGKRPVPVRVELTRVGEDFAMAAAPVSRVNENGRPASMSDFATSRVCSLLKENNIRKGFFETAQFTSVRNHLPVHMQAIVAFANITGWRTPSEILPLEWRQVDLKVGEVRLDAGSTKNGDGRVFPFTLELRRVLEEQLAVAEGLKKAGIITPYVFFFRVGQKAGKRITEGAFHKAWRKARVAAGCPGRIPHDFRRTAVRNLVRAGVPERVAMQLTGHKTRAVFERYNIVSAGDLRDAARRLDTYAASAAS